LSGNGRHRDNWKVFFAEVQAIMYVVDASASEDRFNDHFCNSRFKLQKLLIEDLLNDDIIKRHK
jgi:ADP-ribosylation factor-like protein 6